jgi:transcriptional regulator with XRE-family HTH domain
MPAHRKDGVGARIAYYRSVMRPKMTQRQLADAACVALGTIRKIERGERGVTDATLEAIADALGVDPTRLIADRTQVHTRVHEALPALSAALATYDLPVDGLFRPIHELRTAVAEAARYGWPPSTRASSANCRTCSPNSLAPTMRLAAQNGLRWPAFW